MDQAAQMRGSKDRSIVVGIGNSAELGTMSIIAYKAETAGAVDM